MAPNIVSGLVFCPDCGRLLQYNGTHTHVACDMCESRVPVGAFEKLEVVTKSNPNSFLMDHREIYLWKTKKQTWDAKPQAATINEKCPKCLNPQMNFHTLQLRSADEGQTVFYSCEKCSHTFSVNS